MSNHGAPAEHPRREARGRGGPAALKRIAMSNTDSTKMMQELLARVQRLEDTLEIQKVQSKYLHLAVQAALRARRRRMLREERRRCVRGVLRQRRVSRASTACARSTRRSKPRGRFPGFFILHMTTNPGHRDCEGRPVRAQPLAVAGCVRERQVGIVDLGAVLRRLREGETGSGGSRIPIWPRCFAIATRRAGRRRPTTAACAAPCLRGRMSLRRSTSHTTKRRSSRDMFADHPELPRPF